jgi:hypothetical protein
MQRASVPAPDDDDAAATDFSYAAAGNADATAVSDEPHHCASHGPYSGGHAAAGNPDPHAVVPDASADLRCQHADAERGGGTR